MDHVNGCSWNFDHFCLTCLLFTRSFTIEQCSKPLLVDEYSGLHYPTHRGLSLSNRFIAACDFEAQYIANPGAPAVSHSSGVGTRDIAAARSAPPPGPAMHRCTCDPRRGKGAARCGNPQDVLCGVYCWV